MSTSRANLDITQYVKVNQSQRGILIQGNGDSCRVVLSDVKPARSNTVFHVLNSFDPPMKFRDIDNDVWVLAMTNNTSVTVTEYPGV